MFRKILNIIKWLGVLAVVLLIGNYFLPNDFSVTRSLVIDAPITTVFNEVNDLKRWEEWSAWQASDPSIKVKYGSISEGVNGSYSWKGEKTGAGTLTIKSAQPNREIRTIIDFGEERFGHGTWTFEETDEGTVVTWTFYAEIGHTPYLRYLMHWGSKDVGESLQEGLDRLRAVSLQRVAAKQLQEEERLQAGESD